MDGIVKDREHGTTATVVTVGADGEHGCMTLKNGAAGNMRYSTEVFDIDFSGAKLVSIAIPKLLIRLMKALPSASSPIAV